MMITLNHYVILAAILFGLSLVGMMIHRKNIILLLVCVELMLLAVNTNFVAFSHAYHALAGQVFVFFILTVAAAEAAIGLAIVMLLYRNRGNISIDRMNHLKG
jgi:NADH-quinone oxidoreductase subunit K